MGLGVLAHGAGGLDALGVPLPLLLGFAAACLLGTAAALSRSAARGRAPSARPATAPLVTGERSGRVGPVVTALLLLLLLVVALGGPADRGGNAAALVVLTLWWGGLTVASALLGAVHRRLTPLEPILRWLGAPDDARVDPGATPSVLPAALALAVFLWAALGVFAGGRGTAAILVGWAAFGVVGGLRSGTGWLRRADPFDVWSAAAGWLAPLGRDGDGRVRRRRVRRALARVEAPPGLWLVVAVALGAAAFELVRDALVLEVLTPGGTDPGAIARRTAGFALAVGLAALLVGGVVRRRPWLVPVLVPVAVGATITVLLGPVLVEGQSVAILASDPFAAGWDLFGTSGGYVDAEPLPSALLAAVQLVVFLGAHLVAVVAASDRATARFDPRAARAVQLPVRLLLLLTLLGGIALQMAAAE